VLAVLCLGGGAGAAIVLLGGEDSKPEETSTEAATIPSTTTTTTRTEEASSAPDEVGAAVGAIGAGRYIQVGSFRSVEGAEDERERIEAAGIRVIMIDSSEADELYPGFQVLVAGPFTDPTVESRVLDRLHKTEVPSAFARALTPAKEIGGPEALAGEWAGTLERTGTGSEDLDGPLEVTLSAPADGQTAQLNFKKPDCQLDLALEEAAALSLVYGQEDECVGGGSWRLRPRGDELSLVLLPPHSEVIILGVLDRQ
jgi:hypothetical protein